MTHSELTTLAELSQFRQTGRYAEVEHLCAAFMSRWPDAVRGFEFGRTPEGRPLLALAVSRTGVLNPKEIRRRGLPVLMIQAGIHPGESDGKDAGFMVLRDMLSQKPAHDALSKIVLLFVPVFSADGHERIGPWNRANQNGPEEMGWRANAQNLNLNRDYTKADTPEMQAMLRLMEEWDPVFCADMHVGDGADFEHDVSIQVEPLHLGAPELFELGTSIRDEVCAALRKNGSLPLTFYPVLAEQDNPQAGFVDYIFTPRYSTGYWPLRNRFTLLVETHSWKDYGTRVRITQDVIVRLADLAARDGQQWLKAVQTADKNAAGLGGVEVPVKYALSQKTETIEFRGYEYTREHSEISGGLMTTYHPGRMQVWRVPLRGDIQPVVIERAPKSGYVIPAGFAGEIISKLQLHGVQFEKLENARAQARVLTFRAEAAKFATQPYEGRMLNDLQGQWREEARDIPAGSLFVPIAQPKARLVMALLEPKAPDSFAAWGFFNVVFERKEYMEAYVAEREARAMLARDPKLAAEFKQKLAADPTFAADPEARLDFFYQRHPSWDERFGLYPVYKMD